MRQFTFVTVRRQALFSPWQRRRPGQKCREAACEGRVDNLANHFNSKTKAMGKSIPQILHRLDGDNEIYSVYLERYNRGGKI
jgi:hypothetical protein